MENQSPTNRILQHCASINKRLGFSTEEIAKAAPGVFAIGKDVRSLQEEPLYCLMKYPWDGSACYPVTLPAPAEEAEQRISRYMISMHMPPVRD